jgi:AraC-like DNA-binding protein
MDRQEELVALLRRHASQEGMRKTRLDNLYVYKASEPLVRSPAVYEPLIVIAGQGRKRCYVGDKRYEYRGGNYLVLFLPMPVEVELLHATPEEPFLAAYIAVDLVRLADISLKMDRLSSRAAISAPVDPSGIYTAPLNDQLADTVIRLLRLLDDPLDASMLGASIVDEIYYRILRDERGADIQRLLEQRGQIQRISRAVEHIHQNLSEPVAVDRLAQMVGLSSSGFYKSFKQVMHVSPLQYAKSVKLFRAQALIREGKNASEAGYMVGYNSPAQFSREYKRHFGFSPSATVA